MHQNDVEESAGLRRLSGVFVPISKTQRALEILRTLELTIDGFQLQRNGDAVGIPLAKTPPADAQKILKKELGNYQIRAASFKIIRSKPKTLRDAAHDLIPDELISQLPHSADIIGDVAIVEISSTLEPYSAQIGQAFLAISPQVRLVLRKLGDVTGRFRTRELQTVAGRGGTETVHHEFSCSYKVDVSTVYFNPRLANERRRVAGEVKAGEIVVDMFAGVGPYSILVAKLQTQSRVYAVDINPSAVKYLKENILINEVADRVVPVLGDAEELSRTQLQNVADRVIMNLPSEAERYVDAALRILKTNGGVVHFYQFVQRGISLNSVREHFRNSVVDQKRQIRSINYCDVIREIAPTRVQICLDAAIV